MTPDIPALVCARLAAAGDLPLPGRGRTGERWRTLTTWSHDHLVAGRLLEAHADATAILTELGHAPPEPGQWWGVWAAEPPRPQVVGVRRDATTWILDGTKPWCSGAGWCSHALVTVRDADAPDERHLVAVDLAHPGVRNEPRWANAGMADSRTWSVHFSSVPARHVAPGAGYLDRPGFWHGGAGVAACWLGGAYAVADALLTTGRDDPLTRAHAGRVDATLTAARWAMTAAAAELDADPDDLLAARIRALQVRALVERTAAAVIDDVGRALGAGPLCQDPGHAASVADLSVYVRQSHGDRDLAALGALVLGQEP
ncbi:acyl-CoA dehydrogenase family protein [Granulicoccus sp. GXG6511]|uniref:acyl-CoA dehydrogenase family protein n=1 Tax=Granulicoccus sp. GXG6511 TaxID=3381351 RepID=UPI003D7D58A5